MINLIKQKLLEARLAKDSRTTSILRLIVSELDRKQQYDDAICVKVIKSAIKDNNLAIEYATDDHLDTLIHENKVLESLLPESMSESELEAHIDAFIAENENVSMRLMGALMSELRSLGKDFDGSLASKLFKERL